MSSQTSIGTGTPGDRNENPLSDSEPSRTLGAETGAAGHQPDAPAAEGQPGGPRPEALPADVPGEVSEEDTDLSGAHQDRGRMAQAFPEGPNVAPSPWEDEAARGRG